MARGGLADAGALGRTVSRPGVVDNQRFERVLDLRVTADGPVTAGAQCRVAPFLDALAGLPPGLTVALQNGVRFACPKAPGIAEYLARASRYHVENER